MTYTIQELHERFVEDLSDPSFPLRWSDDARNPKQVRKKPAGTVWTCYRSGRKYGQVSIRKKFYGLHRIYYEFRTGKHIPPGLTIDHIDQNTMNNAFENLRLATQRQQNHNQGKKKNTSSRFKGVSWCKQNKKWHARIRLNGKAVHLHHVADEEDAYRIRLWAELMTNTRHPEFDLKILFPD